jgi:predicted ATPase/class 3 adenylate cyclase
VTRPLPTGTVTFLLTDIEGSTRLVQQLGDRFNDLIDDHHELLRGAFKAAGGTEVSTEGDAFFVVFERAGDAVKGAVEAQRTLARYSWGEGISVRVRMGLHAGVATTAGDNYTGIDVHRAARIAKAAHGGQVLLSAATARLAEQWLPEGVRAKDLGEFRLKDLNQPEHLFQLRIDGIPSDFPPPRTLAPRLTNLPRALTVFVGRDREREQVAALLEANRLVTLTGPGGTGKTRLAFAIGEQVLGSFRDGTYAVHLAPLEDPMLVASTIAQTLGLREHGAIPIQETIQDYLATKELLLILDNFEHLIEAAPIVPELLQAAPNIKIVVTSRTPLRMRGEQEYAVPSMALPNPERVEPLGTLLRYEAVDLFVQRAQAAIPSFSLTADTAGVIAEICHRLDGLPLAIELAAARIRMMSPEQILTRLDAALSFLKSGARDLPQRQRTLRDAFAWSYDLLDPPHRAFFARLGVFAGGFDLSAVDDVTDTHRDLGIDSLDAVEAMLDASLVRRTSSSAGDVRLRLLQTVREFAIDRLREAGQEAPTRSRHAKWFLRLAEDAAPRFTTGEEVPGKIELEHDNVRSALRWMIDSGDANGAMRLGAAMWRFWQLRSHLAEGRRWLTEIVVMDPGAEPTLARGRAVMALGSIAYWQNDFEATRSLYREALEILRAVSDERGVQEGLYNVAFLSLLQKDPGAAHSLFHESRTIAERLGDKKALADTAWGLAMAAIQMQDWAAATGWGTESKQLYAELGDLFGTGLARFVFYQVARYTGKIDEARSIMVATLQDADVRDGATTSSSLELLAEIEMLDDKVDRAVKLRAASESLREDYGGGSPPPLIDLSDIREAACSRLDPRSVHELWEEGRSMSWEEVMAFALKDAGAEPPSAIA